VPNTTLTLESIKTAIESNLGDCGVEIELDDDSYKQVLADAVRLYNRCRPQREIVPLPVTTGQKRYGPFQATWNGVVGVVDVSFVNSRLSGRVDPFDPMTYQAPGGIGSPDGTSAADLSLILQGQEEARRVASAETEWKAVWDRAGNLYLYIDVQQDGLSCSVTYTWHVTPTDDPVNGLKHIPDGDTDWIINFATARAKQILSRVRGKHKGIVNPDGATDAVDDAELAQEGRDDERDLKTEIEARRRPLPPAVE
jgi:hypothetical protein